MNIALEVLARATKKLVAVSIAVIPWGTPASRADEAPLSAEELARIESQCLESRRQIRSAELEVSWKLTRWVDGQPTPEVQGSEYHLISGSRQLLKKKQFMGGERPPVHFVHCWNCNTQGMFLHYAEEASSRSPASFSKMKEDDPSTVAWRRKPNPLLIGMVWSQYARYSDRDITLIIGRSNRHSLTASRTRLEGRDVIAVSFDRDPPAPDTPRRIGRCWISPDEGYQIVRSEFETPTTLTRAEYELQQDPRGKYWFPKTYRIEEFQNQSPVGRHVGEVRLISLNEPIPAERFDVENIGLPAGTKVMNRPGADGTEVFDGTMLEEPEAYEAEQARLAKEEKQARWIRRVLQIAGGFGVIGLLVSAYMYVRRRQRTG